ncbi:O-antigen ligase family protein [Actinomycetospora sp. TBRC 11914]|nr:O-antigen ligase family protein [Actinomycetospora sp. TBRC 11914]
MSTVIASARKRSPLLLVFDVGLAILCLLFAQSQSSILAAVALIMVWLAVRGVQRFENTTRYIALTGVSLLGGAILAWALLSLDTLVGSLGRDLTFTGRQIIWDAVLQEAGESPVLGYGWNAVWHDDLPLTNTIWNITKFSIYQAHEGYLDVYIQIGGLGLFLLCILILSTVTRSIRTAVRGAAGHTYWPLAAIIVLIVSNFSESRFVTPIGLLFLFLTYQLSGVCPAMSRTMSGKADACRVPSGAVSKSRAAGRGACVE